MLPLLSIRWTGGPGVSAWIERIPGGTGGPAYPSSAEESFLPDRVGVSGAGMSWRGVETMIGARSVRRFRQFCDGKGPGNRALNES